jgi:hypothetical protein
MLVSEQARKSCAQCSSRVPPWHKLHAGGQRREASLPIAAKFELPVPVTRQLLRRREALQTGIIWLLRGGNPGGNHGGNWP